MLTTRAGQYLIFNILIDHQLIIMICCYILMSEIRKDGWAMEGGMLFAAWSLCCFLKLWVVLTGDVCPLALFCHWLRWAAGKQPERKSREWDSMVQGQHQGWHCSVTGGNGEGKWSPKASQPEGASYDGTSVQMAVKPAVKFGNKFSREGQTYRKETKTDKTDKSMSKCMQM